MNNFRALLIASVALAIMAFASPWVVSLKASVWFALLWGVVVLVALFSFRKRAFWCLVGRTSCRLLARHSPHLV